MTCSSWFGWKGNGKSGVSSFWRVSPKLRITALLEEDHRKIEAMPAAANSLRLHGYLKREPFTSVKAATKKLGLSTPTVQGAFDRLEGAGLLHEITGRSRGRLYAYTKYVEILEEGTEPLAQTG